MSPEFKHLEGVDWFCAPTVAQHFAGVMLDQIEQFAARRAEAITPYEVQRHCFRIANARLPLTITPAIQKALAAL